MRTWRLHARFFSWSSVPRARTLFQGTQGKYHQLHLRRGKVTLAAIFLRRVRVAGFSFMVELTYVTPVVAPPAPAAQSIGTATGCYQHVRLVASFLRVSTTSSKGVASYHLSKRAKTYGY
jgi:hypothetical protein